MENNNCYKELGTKRLLTKNVHPSLFHLEGEATSTHVLDKMSPKKSIDIGINTELTGSFTCRTCMSIQFEDKAKTMVDIAVQCTMEVEATAILPWPCNWDVRSLAPMEFEPGDGGNPINVMQNKLLQRPSVVAKEPFSEACGVDINTTTAMQSYCDSDMRTWKPMKSEPGVDEKNCDDCLQSEQMHSFTSQVIAQREEGVVTQPANSSPNLCNFDGLKLKAIKSNLDVKVKDPELVYNPLDQMEFYVLKDDLPEDNSRIKGTTWSTQDRCKGDLKTSICEAGVDGKVADVMNNNSQPIGFLFNEPLLGHSMVSTSPTPLPSQSKLQQNDLSRVVLETSIEEIAVRPLIEERLLPVPPEINGHVTFNEVAVYFSEEEWQRLGHLEKGLYKEVIVDNYHLLQSLGYVHEKPDIVHRFERGEDVVLSHQQEMLWRNGFPVSNPGCATIIQMDPKYSPLHTSYWTCHYNVLSRAPEEQHPMEKNEWPFHGGKKSDLRQEFHQDMEKSGTPDPSNNAIVDNQPKKAVYMETTGLDKGLERGEKIHPRTHLKSHQKIYTGERPHVCNKCGARFAVRGSLIKHQRTHTGEKPFECHKCSKKFSQSSHLNKHLKCHMKQPCSECGHLITNSTKLQLKQKDCQKCNQRLKERLQATSQTQPKKREKIYQCPQCEKFFTRKSNLVVHYRTHTGEKPYSCSDCGKTFTDKSNLVSHLRTHTGEKPYSCTECGKSFPYCSALVIHKRTHTGEKPFVCNECGKSFVCNSHLVLHMKAHIGDRPFGCELCGKSFPCSSTLVKHQIIHTGERPYICLECGKTFIRGSHLVIHQRTHTGEKPYMCSDCGKGFTDKSNLKSHQRTHKTERNYECKECGQKFTRSSTLRNHKLIHTKEKPFACPECGKCFSRKCNLMIHLRVHTGEKPYTCTVCDRRFSLRPHLVKHQKIHK